MTQKLIIISKLHRDMNCYYLLKNLSNNVIPAQNVLTLNLQNEKK